ncbi:protein GOS9-like [Curcuma longa]|uniref:protein GOS9-like n=1 Tax=Curcuma longa TaxID=136217 RepID=UPI003D9ED091
MAEPSFTELCKSNEQNITLKVGPWGGSGVSAFDFGESDQVIKKVVVYSGDVVDSLEISYYTDKPNVFESYPVGGPGGGPNECPLSQGEYINNIFGSVNGYDNEICVTEIGFETNLEKKYGPFGKGGGEKFSIPVVNGRIVGFFGQYNKYINGIGVSLALN